MICLCGAKIGVKMGGERQTAAKRGGIVRFVPLLFLGAGLAAFFALGLEHQLTFTALKAHREELTRYTAANPLQAALAFAGAYVVVVACSIPIAALLTLTGGFLFGTVEGGLLVLAGATVGATLVFLAARTALAGFLSARVGGRIKAMEEGFRRNAFNYLLVLRLIPVFPFFLVNLGAGLLGVELRTYVAATALGIIPGTFVYAALGNGLGHLFDIGATPDLKLLLHPEFLVPLVGLAALALLPPVWRAMTRKA